MPTEGDDRSVHSEQTAVISVMASFMDFHGRAQQKAVDNSHVISCVGLSMDATDEGLGQCGLAQNRMSMTNPVASYPIFFNL